MRATLCLGAAFVRACSRSQGEAGRVAEAKEKLSVPCSTLLDLCIILPHVTRELYTHRRRNCSTLFSPYTCSFVCSNLPNCDKEPKIKVRLKDDMAG